MLENTIGYASYKYRHREGGHNELHGTDRSDLYFGDVHSARIQMQIATVGKFILHRNLPRKDGYVFSYIGHNYTATMED